MRRILIVDDSPNFRLSLKAYLECPSVENAYLEYPSIEVNTVSDGLTALSMLTSTFYHLLITDLRMPEMSGIDLANRVRRLSPATRILLMTADPLPDPSPLTTTTLDAILPKTVNIDRIRDTVRDLLATSKEKMPLY